MKASILGSILFVALATASPMESHPSPNGAAMDMKNMPSAAMNMKHGMRMGKMPSANDDDRMDMMGMKRGTDMNMDDLPADSGNDPMGMDMPMEGKGQLPGMNMRMPTEGAKEDMPRDMSGAESMPDAEMMPGMDIGMDVGIDGGMGMDQDKEGMME